jgi:hypothetical protein
MRERQERAAPFSRDLATRTVGFSPPQQLLLDQLLSLALNAVSITTWPLCAKNGRNFRECVPAAKQRKHRKFNQAIGRVVGAAGLGVVQSPPESPP